MLITVVDLSKPRKLVQRKFNDIALDMKLNNVDLKPIIAVGTSIISAVLLGVAINSAYNVAIPVISNAVPNNSELVKDLFYYFR